MGQHESCLLVSRRTHRGYLQAILNFGIGSAVFCVLAIAVCMSELNRVSIAKSNHRTKQSIEVLGVSFDSWTSQ